MPLSTYFCNKNSDVSKNHKEIFHKKKDQHNMLIFNWPTRIRTLKMLESESSALPFGDGPLSSDREYSIITLFRMQALF